MVSTFNFPINDDESEVIKNALLYYRDMFDRHIAQAVRGDIPAYNYTVSRWHQRAAIARKLISRL